jgi:hypothetical protein
MPSGQQLLTGTIAKNRTATFVNHPDGAADGFQNPGVESADVPDAVEHLGTGDLFGQDDLDRLEKWQIPLSDQIPFGGIGQQEQQKSQPDVLMFEGQGDDPTSGPSLLGESGIDFEYPGSQKAFGD